jgi:phosphatidylserine/phosphatidylglycerophosphate/cardiolipin synthase-like enzyme
VSVAKSAINAKLCLESTTLWRSLRSGTGELVSRGEKVTVDIMLKRAIPLLFLLPLAAVPVATRPPAQIQPAAQQDRLMVFFSPNGCCTDAIVAAIDRAKQSVDIQGYSFTSTPIAKAAVDAHKRGVKVRAVLDKSNNTAEYSAATFLKNAQVPTFIDSSHNIAHNKVIIVDGATVVTGSFNFTKTAEEQHAENVLIITGKPQIAAAYVRNFEQHLAHSKPYTGPQN